MTTGRVQVRDVTELHERVGGGEVRAALTLSGRRHFDRLRASAVSCVRSRTAGSELANMAAVDAMDCACRARRATNSRITTIAAGGTFAHTAINTSAEAATASPTDEKAEMVALRRLLAI